MPETSLELLTLNRGEASGERGVLTYSSPSWQARRLVGFGSLHSMTLSRLAKAHARRSDLLLACLVMKADIVPRSLSPSRARGWVLCCGCHVPSSVALRSCSPVESGSRGWQAKKACSHSSQIQRQTQLTAARLACQFGRARVVQRLRHCPPGQYGCRSSSNTLALCFATRDRHTPLCEKLTLFAVDPPCLALRRVVWCCDLSFKVGGDL